MLVFAVLAVAALLGAAALRARDAPFIAYEQGDVGAALAGLTARAEAGNGFAAYLVARAHYSGAAGAVDLHGAAGWYLAAARAGEIRAVAPYLGIVLGQSPDEDTCRKALVLLELAARAGDVDAVVSRGQAHQAGRCGPADMQRAASYYVAATRLDRRMEVWVEVARKSLSAEDMRAVRPLPESFDLNPQQALARFIDEAPALPPDSLR